jgi:hypothetical protein
MATSLMCKVMWSVHKKSECTHLICRGQLHAELLKALVTAYDDVEHLWVASVARPFTSLAQLVHKLEAHLRNNITEIWLPSVPFLLADGQA